MSLGEGHDHDKAQRDHERGRQMNRIGLLRDERYLKHVPGPSHVESPDRLTAIHQAIDAEFKTGDFTPIEPRLATFEELTWNHYPDYVRSIEATQGVQPYMALDPDTITCPESYNVARLAVGGLFTTIDAVVSGSTEGGMCLVRPPGHHAEPDRAMGFCLFNNIALGAHYCQKVHGLHRCLIVDFDLHHGNGTQKSFYYNSSVLYFSTHQYPYYPGTGSANEVGAGQGKGFTVNCPLPAGCSDQDYAAIFRELLVPVASSYSPDIVLVSAGMDIYWQDPLGGMNVTEKGIAAISRALIDIAQGCSGGRIIFVLEGGYSKEGLVKGVLAIMKQLLQRDSDLSEVEEAHALLDSAVPNASSQSLKKALETQRVFWSSL